MKFVVCPLCGANLEFGEKCDCVSGENEIKKLVLFAKLLLDNEQCERAKAEAERQGIPFFEYVDNEFEQTLRQAEKERKTGGDQCDNEWNYTGKQACLQR